MTSTNDEKSEIIAATCWIDDRMAFLRKIREIAEAFETHIICFNADMVAGEPHVQAAIFHAVRSFRSGSPISNSLEMEALLYAAGTRQTSVGSKFGVHLGENRMYVCWYPCRDGIRQALTSLVRFCMTDEPWGSLDEKKQRVLMQLFDISEEELSSTIDHNLTDLVLERVALLDVYK